MEPDAENIWAPAGGEPVIIRVEGRCILMSVEYLYPEFEVVRSDAPLYTPAVSASGSAPTKYIAFDGERGAL